MRIKKENAVLVSLIQRLLKQDRHIWRKVAQELARPRRKRVEVNLSKIEQYSAPDSTVLVPGKVLGSGNLTKKITVAAFTFSESAKKMISDAGCTMLSIDELLEKNPTGSGVIIIK